MKARTLLIASLLCFATVMFFGFDRLAESQPAPSLDAGPVTSDIATVKPPESVPAATVQAPDPVADPGGFIDSVRKLFQAGALVPAVLLACYGLLLLARSRVAWLREGKNAVYSAAALTFLTAIAEAASRGNTPTLGMITAALFAAITLALKPEATVK